jgi:hypothetical protein
MAQVVCASCGRAFLVRPQSPKQTYCSAPECQRERRRRWSKAKLESDPDYRANQLAAQQAWHARHPEYWQTYRGRRPSAAPSRPVRTTRATSDASFCGADPGASLCWIEILSHGPDGNTQAWRVEMTLTRPPVCKDGRVQIDDSWPRPALPPNVPQHSFEIPVSIRRDA